MELRLVLDKSHSFSFRLILFFLVELELSKLPPTCPPTQPQLLIMKQF